MARQIVVLALVLIALVGFVSADNDESAKTAPSTGSQGGAEAAAAPVDDEDTIGNTDEEVGASIGNTDVAAAGAPSNTDGAVAGVAVEGPIGSEEAAKTAASQSPPSSGATTLGASAVAGAAAVAGYFIF